MFWRYFVILSILLLVHACSPGSPPRPDWSTSVNQQLIADEGENPAQGESSVPEASLSLAGVECGNVDSKAYIVHVSWLITAEEIKGIKIEYEVAGASEPEHERMLNPVELSQSDLSPSGRAEVAISADEIVDVGDVILVRLVVDAGKSEIMSNVARYKIAELCP